MVYFITTYDIPIFFAKIDEFPTVLTSPIAKESDTTISHIKQTFDKMDPKRRVLAGISTKSVYGVIATYYIYKHQEESAVKIQEISQKMDLPKNYLEQILLLLKKAHILKSIRGAKGGYILAKDAQEITVLEIMEALEGSFCEFEFGSRECSLISFWEEAQKGVKKQFDIPINELEKYKNDRYKEFVYVI